MEVSQNIFDTKKSIERARKLKGFSAQWSIKLADKEFVWKTKLERVFILRKGLPYDSIEVISKRADLPVKTFLNLLGVAQTTYNKKKREKSLLSSRDSEIVLVLIELLDYGSHVFNGEIEKFHRWLRKPNISLGRITPESLFDSLTGIQVVRSSLDRIEYGNFA